MIEIEEEKRDGIFLVRFTGQLDAHGVAKVEKELLEKIDSGEIHVLLDWQNVDLLTSAGLRLLLQVSRRVEKSSGKTVVLAEHPNVTDVMRLSGMNRIVTLQNSEEQALAFLRSDAESN